MNAPAAYDLAPTLAIALIGALLALGPVAWVWRRQRGVDAATRSSARLRALTLLTLCVTFDLVLFGAFTRLTDSGLGCPDWPGCYGSASPLGAHAEIHAAQSARPSGPVTHGKAWIEMTHRYLATGVGVLTALLVALNGVEAWRRRAPWRTVGWAVATFVWVGLQGLFGMLTVTMKLYPAIVTAHLLGGLVLLVLLAVQTQLQRPSPLPVPPALFAATWVLALLSVVQIAFGGWVSTNYAVLACTDFPTCQGAWWPAMDWSQGFAWLRELGVGRDGSALPFAALTAIHYAHRLGAYVVLVGMLLFAWRLLASGDAALRPWARATLAIAAWQLASGLSNVLLGWPLGGAVAHTAGAAAWVTLLALMITRLALARRRQADPAVIPRAWQAAP
jgi:cytochrome c oxidase assembly protein subunit 15